MKQDYVFKRENRISYIMYSIVKKKSSLFLLLVLLISNLTLAQKKAVSASTAPYSISNIKLGMTSDEFFLKYKDSIEEEDVFNSTRTLLYKSLMINNIKVFNVLVKFYKNKLIMLSFRCDDTSMHNGLDAKYGYDFKHEITDDSEGISRVLGGYGKVNDEYDMFRVQYDNGDLDHYLMQDKKGYKLSVAEGF